MLGIVARSPGERAIPINTKTSSRRPTVRWLMCWMRSGAALAIGAWLSMAVAGCAHFHSVALEPATEAENFGARRLDDPGLKAFTAGALAAPENAVAPPSWDLSRLTLAALYFHPDLLIAQAQLATSQAAVKTAGQIPNPTFTVLGGPSTQYIGYSLGMLFETFGKRGYRISQAERLVGAAQWNVVNTAWQIRSTLRTAFLTYWSAERKLALAQRSLSAEERLVGLEEQRVAQGEGSAPELALVRVARAQTVLAASALEKQLEENRVALAVAIGVPVDAVKAVTLDTAEFDSPPVVPEDGSAAPLRRRAMTERADVKNLLAQYQASQAALQLQIASQYPNITLTAAYNYDFRNQFELNPAVEQPLFNQNQGPIAEAEAKRREAAARFLALQASVIGQIEQGTASYRAATAAVMKADRLVEDERQRLLQMQQSFQAGAVDRPTLVTVELEATTIQASRFDAVVLQRQAVGLLEDGLQQPLFDPSMALRVPERSMAHRAGQP